MSQKRLVQAQYEFLSLPALQNGLTELQTREREALAELYVKEARKGAFRPQEHADVVKAFVVHVQASFAENDEVKEVIDFQPRLLATARMLSTRNHPIESLILYATWAEHWLNGVLLTTMLDRNVADPDAVDVLRQGNIRSKLGAIWRLLSLPELPEPQRTSLELLAEVRNEHVHYKWRGVDQDILFGPGNRIKLAMQDIDATIVSLVDFELDRVVGDEIAVANELFSVDLRPVLRSRALDWQPPDTVGDRDA